MLARFFAQGQLNQRRSPEPALGNNGELIADLDMAFVGGGGPDIECLAPIAVVSDEMESDEHQALREMLDRIGLKSFVQRRFEFGLNNLMLAFR